jgi:hypothetical protein
MVKRSYSTKESNSGLIYGSENGLVDRRPFFPALFIFSKLQMGNTVQDSPAYYYKQIKAVVSRQSLLKLSGI